jgi:hypothetical protein
MIQMNFGNGEIGVRFKCSPNVKNVVLGPLKKAQELGTEFSNKDFQPMVNLTFETEEGLDVLINALQCCKASFVEIPLELRMGA